MIEEVFGSNGEIFFEIDLVTNDGLNLPVEAMFDTGFTKYLAINQQDVLSLGWTYLRKEELQTAQGSSLFEVYLGKVIINHQEFEIPVFSDQYIQKILLGLQWLKHFDLLVKYRENILRLE